MIIYHGTTETIQNPLAKAGRSDLDFGQGFYTTDMLEQAQIWADRMHRQRHEELSKHRPNNQICIISQRLIDDSLKYKETQLC